MLYVDILLVVWEPSWTSDCKYFKIRVFPLLIHVNTPFYTVVSICWCKYTQISFRWLNCSQADYTFKGVIFMCVFLLSTRKTFLSSRWLTGQTIHLQCSKCGFAWFLGWEYPLQEGLATHPCILAWRIPRTRGAWRATVKGSQRVRHNWSDWACTHAEMHFKNLWKCVCVCVFSSRMVVSSYIK